MTPAETLPQPDIDDSGTDSATSDYIAATSRTDGSRTPVWKIARCWQMKRDGRSLNAIAQVLGMDNRTVAAVLSRQDSMIDDARMLLNANALGFAGDAIQASQEAAKRGKIEGISAMLDRLGVTEPPKSQAQTQVGVQVILHGGATPQELSRAKVTETSEGPQIQAVSEAGLIIDVMNTAVTPTQSTAYADVSVMVNSQPPASAQPAPAAANHENQA